MNLSDEQRQQRYIKSRSELDSIFSEFNGKINPHIENIVDYKAFSFLVLIKEWVDLYRDDINKFADVVDFTNIKVKLGQAISQYTKYVYNYRFCNNLTNNILFRKILSFEMYFLSKHGVLGNKMPNIFSEEKLSDNESLFHLSPLAHFMFYRIQKELHVRVYNLAEAHRTAELYEEILISMRKTMYEFFYKYNDNDCRIHSQDDFRKFLAFPNNKNLLSVIEFIEKNLTVNI